MSKDIVKIGLQAKIENLDEIERLINDLEEKLHNLKITLKLEDVKDDKEEIELTLEEILEEKIEEMVCDIKNSIVYIGK